MKKNWPFIIITGFGIFATFVFLYFFVYGMAVNTVRSSVLIEKAYPNIKPAEYINELRLKAKKNNLKLIEVRSEKNYYLVQIIDEKKLDEILSLSPKFAPLSIINFVIYDLGNGTAVVGNNPYIWDIVAPDNYIDDVAEEFSVELSDILDSIYWDLKKRKESLN
ncbi:hypothetical protein [Persephonella sp.]